jgi:hypothetical protein
MIRINTDELGTDEFFCTNPKSVQLERMSEGFYFFKVITTDGAEHEIRLTSNGIIHGKHNAY